MKIKKFVISYYKSLLVFLLILFASIIPADEVTDVSWLSFPNLDKLIHLGMYFTFTLVLIFDISKSKPSYSNQKIYLFSGFLAFFYGGILEFGQFAFTDSRSGDFFDFLFNTAGALLAILLWLILKKTK